MVLVRDGSGSMSGQKAQDASSASLDLVAELAQPANKDGFVVGVVDFATKSQIVHDITRAGASASTGSSRPVAREKPTGRQR